MVLSSAAASTQTTILPTARTRLSMAVYKAIPKSFARMHPRFLTPTVSTIAMGAISIAVYVGFNYASNGIGIIGDAVIAIGLYIAFYYGLTGFTCAWYYRRNLTSSRRRRRAHRRGRLPLLPDRQPELLQEGDADQGHADAGAGRVTRGGRAFVRDVSGTAYP
jgi:amino acid transporter